MKKNTEKILGFDICTLSQKKIITNIKKDIDKGIQNIIYNVNPLIITNFYKDTNIVKEFNEQKYNIPDGIGIVIASKLKRLKIKKRIAGIEFVDDLMKLANDNKYTIYFYGAKPGIVEKAKEKLEEKYKDIKIIGTIDGYVDESVALKDIKKEKPDILLLGLGSPKQENFIINNKKELKNIKVIIPVGGSFDVISGTLKRAPKFFIKFNLEWLYRMIKEPKRIKQNMNLIKFVFLVIFRNKYYNKRRESGDK